MASETEVKILDIDTEDIKQKLVSAGAEKLLDVRLVVEWFRPKGQQEGEETWYLRIRKRSDGIAEVTWKGKSEVTYSRLQVPVRFTWAITVHKSQDLHYNRL